MSAPRILVCASLIFLFANAASAARYQRTKDGKTLVWNNLRGVAQEVTWSGLSDLNGYATGEGTLTWYRLGGFVNSYTGKMVRGKFEGPVIRLQGSTQVKANFTNGEKTTNWVEPESTATPTATPAPSIAASPIATTPTPTPVVPQQSETPSIEPLPIASPLPTATSTPTPRPSPRLSSTSDAACRHRSPAPGDDPPGA